MCSLSTQVLVHSAPEMIFLGAGATVAWQAGARRGCVAGEQAGVLYLYVDSALQVKGQSPCNIWGGGDAFSATRRLAVCVILLSSFTRFISCSFISAGLIPLMDSSVKLQFGLLILRI